MFPLGFFEACLHVGCVSQGGAQDLEALLLKWVGRVSNLALATVGADLCHASGLVAGRIPVGCPDLDSGMAPEGISNWVVECSGSCR